MQFLDEVKIYVKAGDGGPGCLSFRREKNIPFGGPDGGNGGSGGNIIVQAVSGLNTLIDYRYQQHFKARNGEHGKGDNRSGESRPDLILKVPVGTQILTDDGQAVIADLLEEGESFILAKSGRGGFGNAHFKSSINRAPRRITKGEIGEEIWVWFKLKLISDAGLVGLPNAGKSTFLSKVTAAKPKIADYPFTTIKPQLGVVYIDEIEFVLADLPGLIEDAHLGVGLGDKFLKHIERCGVILHLIDGTQDNIVKAYKTIKRELTEYSPTLATKTEIVGLNKCDALDSKEIAKKVKALQKASGKEVMTLSGVTGEGTTDILRKLRKEIELYRAKQSVNNDTHDNITSELK